jgi:K+/H+ antiporter YhaU regulatory subunit KhtT
MPGDVVLLMGSRQHLNAATEFLQLEMRKTAGHAESRAAQLRTQRFVVREGSPWTGRTLHELDLPGHTGTHVVGLQHGERAVTNPGGASVLEPGSVLVLFGLDEQLERAVARLSGSTGTSSFRNDIA